MNDVLVGASLETTLPIRISIFQVIVLFYVFETVRATRRIEVAFRKLNGLGLDAAQLRHELVLVFRSDGTYMTRTTRTCIRTSYPYR